MPLLVDTEFSREIGGHYGVKPSVVADVFLTALANNEFDMEQKKSCFHLDDSFPYWNYYFRGIKVYIVGLLNFNETIGRV